MATVSRLSTGVAAALPFAPCHFHYTYCGLTYALENSDALKFSGDEAIPGFHCDFTGDSYKGHPLQYGPVRPDKWIPWPATQQPEYDDACAELMAMLDEEIANCTPAVSSPQRVAIPATPAIPAVRVPLARLWPASH